MKKLTAITLILILLTSFVIGTGACAESSEASDSNPLFFVRVAAMFYAKEQWTATSSPGLPDTLNSSEWFVFGDSTGEVYMRKDRSEDIYRVFIQLDPNSMEPMLVLFFLGMSGDYMIYSGTYQ